MLVADIKKGLLRLIPAVPVVVLGAILASPAGAAAGKPEAVASAKARIAAAAPGLLVSLADRADSSVLPRGSVLISRLSHAYIVPFSPVLTPRRQIRTLKSLPGVITVQQNNRLSAAAPPGPCTTTPINPLIDPIYSLRIDQMELPPEAATIAVLDSGIDADRNEFVRKIVAPFSFAAGTADFTDTDGHGTAVAGVAAAIEGGIRGVSPASNIMPIKVLDQNGETTSAILVQGIDYAVENGAGVINISAAGPASGTSAYDDATVTKAIGNAFSRGILVVAPTGNDGSEEPSVPSAYPHVLSVGGTDGSHGRRAGFSNYGESVDLMAPASMIPAPVPGSVCPQGYTFASGTSFAAPALSGAAAILKQLRPELSPTQIIDLFREAARDIGEPGWDLDTGFGAADLQVASSASAPGRDGNEVDDDVYWVTGSRAGKHKPVLTAARKSKIINARISGYNDPTDVYRMSLKKRDKLTVVFSGLPGQTIILELWNKKAKNFDITDRNVDKRRIAYRQGTGKKLKLSRKIAATGSYYLAVSALTQEHVLDEYTISFRRGK